MTAVVVSGELQRRSADAEGTAGEGAGSAREPVLERRTGRAHRVGERLERRRPAAGTRRAPASGSARRARSPPASRSSSAACARCAAAAPRRRPRPRRARHARGARARAGRSATIDRTGATEPSWSTSGSRAAVSAPAGRRGAVAGTERRSPIHGCSASPRSARLTGFTSRSSMPGVQTGGTVRRTTAGRHADDRDRCAGASRARWRRVTSTPSSAGQLPVHQHAVDVVLAPQRVERLEPRADDGGPAPEACELLGDQHLVDRVVLDHQHVRAWAHPGRGHRRRCRAARRYGSAGSTTWNSDPSPHGRLDLDATTERDDDPLGDRQSQTRAARPQPPGPLLERLEDPLEVVGRDAPTGVAHPSSAARRRRRARASSTWTSIRPVAGELRRVGRPGWSAPAAPVARRAARRRARPRRVRRDLRRPSAASSLADRDRVRDAAGGASTARLAARPGPPRCCEYSSRSSTRCSNCSDWRWAVSTSCATERGTSVVVSSSVRPRSACSWLRSSWLTRATNSERSRDCSSASSRRCGELGLDPLAVGDVARGDDDPADRRVVRAGSPR